MPIISKFKDRPKTKAGWVAMCLGLPLVFVGPGSGLFAAVIWPFIDSVAGEVAGAAVGFVSALLRCRFI